MLKEELSNQILAVLFVAQQPVTLLQFQEIYPDIPRERLQQVMTDLARQFNHAQSAVEIRQMAMGYRMTTRPHYHEVIRAYLKTKPSAKLSLAALETAAIIAYKQPITLPEVLEIRGIKSTSTIWTLLKKKLIETRGRKKVVGRPIMYRTTREFLVYFGLNDLSELPTLGELEEILSFP